MKIMKLKTILVLAALVMVSTTGTAFARHGGYGGNWGRYGRCGGYYNEPYCYSYNDRYSRNDRYSYNRSSRYDMSKEMQDKLAEARKMEFDIDVELDKNPIDREKVLALREKHSTLMKEIYDWEFKQELDRRR